MIGCHPGLRNCFRKSQAESSQVFSKLRRPLPLDIEAKQFWLNSMATARLGSHDCSRSILNQPQGKMGLRSPEIWKVPRSDDITAEPEVVTTDKFTGSCVPLFEIPNDGQSPAGNGAGTDPIGNHCILGPDDIRRRRENPGVRPAIAQIQDAAAPCLSRTHIVIKNRDDGSEAIGIKSTV